MNATTTPPARLSGLSKASPASRPSRIATVLVPLDFSHASAKALDYALALIEQFGAQLHLVYVCDYDHSIPTAELAASFTLPEGEVIDRARRRLREFAAKHEAELPSRNLHVATGRAYHEICELAAKLDADLIVAATRGHTGLKHLVMGSTAEKIVQHAHCPVLIVREREHDFMTHSENGDRSLRLKKILVPVDFSACSMRGLDFAVPFAHFWNAELVLYNSVAMASFAPCGELGVRDVPMTDAYVYSETEKLIRETASKTLERGVVAESVVEIGPASRQICDYAERHDVDLIVLSTHGTTGLLHALIGSTAEHVVRYAHSPVLVVPTRTAKL